MAKTSKLFMVFYMLQIKYYDVIHQVDARICILMYLCFVNKSYNHPNDNKYIDPHQPVKVQMSGKNIVNQKKVSFTYK